MGLGVPEWKNNRWALEDVLVTGGTGVFTGSWKRTHGIHPFAVSVEGIFTGSVVIYGSRAPSSRPLDADNSRIVLGTIVNGSGEVEIDATMQWVKVAAPGGITGTCDAFLQAAEQPT